MVPRTLRRKLIQLARRFPIVTVTGPRQSGKTTLCRMAFPRKPYVSLEAPDVRAYAHADPRGFLSAHASGAILDEVQRAPELLSYLQGEVDARPAAGRFVLTGSTNLALLHGVPQSLAGRTAMLTLLPLDHHELLGFPDPPRDLFDVLWHGGYPAIFDRQAAPGDWLGSYVATYVERDVRQVLNVTDLLAFHTFLRLCAGRTGQLLNLSALAADAGITHNTARAWLSVLEASYLAFRLPAMHANARKRLVKAPKLHFYDTGLLCYLLGIHDPEQLRRHPLRGPVFESWVVSEIAKARLHRGLPASLSFYRESRGEEIDVVLERGDAVVALEVKSGQTVATDFFPPLARFEASLRQRPGAGDVVTVVAYGGDRSERRDTCRVVPWNSLKDFDWTGATARS